MTAADLTARDHARILPPRGWRMSPAELQARMPTIAEIWAPPDRTAGEWAQICGKSHNTIRQQMRSRLGFHRTTRGARIIEGPCIGCGARVEAETRGWCGRCPASRTPANPNPPEPVPAWKLAYDAELPRIRARREAEAQRVHAAMAPVREKNASLPGRSPGRPRKDAA